MTEKQENILNAALELFANEGYNATSTNKVAKAAGVSEGLIFRHFGNKEGLLAALLKVGEDRFKSLYADIVMESDPEKIIRKAILLPFQVPESEYTFWKLQFKLKWEMEVDGKEKTEPLLRVLKYAFEKLGYAEPEKEASLIVFIHEGMSGAILKGVPIDKQAFQTFLLEKYNV